MPYNSVADSFQTKNFVADFLQVKCNFAPKTAVMRFWALFKGENLGEMYDDHLRLFGKRVVDFLLVLIELSLGVTAEALRANIGSNL